MKIITEFKTKPIEEEIEGIIPGEVKEWGCSAHIPFQKKFIGKKVKVLVLEEENSPNNDKKENINKGVND